MQKRMILWLTIFIMGVMSANAQKLELKGKVLDNRGEPLIGVSVVEKGSNPFWASPAVDWTCKKAWNGQDVGADHAIR